MARFTNREKELWATKKIYLLERSILISSRLPSMKISMVCLHPQIQVNGKLLSLIPNQHILSALLSIIRQIIRSLWNRKMTKSLNFPIFLVIQLLILNLWKEAWSKLKKFIKRSEDSKRSFKNWSVKFPQMRRWCSCT